MSEAENFRQFLNNLAIDNAGVISTRYGEITSALNKKFRSTESRTANSLQVGSYGRKTAVRGVSDLDMLYLIPASAWKNYALGGQSSLLEAAKDAIQARYSTTKVTVDRMVVRVLYNNFHIEVQPVFEQEDGFLFPDTYNGGSWRLTKPREEKEATAKMDAEKNGNLRHLCKMVRAWKNKHGVAMGGLLIDTLAHRFLESTTVYDKASYASYGDMATVFFEYLADEPKKDRYTALGSGQHVKAKKSFKGKAKKALKLAQKASAEKKEASRQKKWRKVFGPPFPIDRVEIQKRADVLEAAGVSNTEEFFDERFTYDVKYDIKISCEVTQKGYRTLLLRDILRRGIRLQRRRSLRFFIPPNGHDIRGHFDLFWKILNRGPEAVSRNMLRGQIVRDRGKLEKKEDSDFYGDHYVECAAVQNGVVVATDRIQVPIEQQD